MRREILYVLVLFLSAILLLNCSKSSPESTEQANYVDEMDDRTRIRFRQYMIQGKKLYELHCANCHQSDGTGLAKLIPPLAKADYLMDSLMRTVCVIKNGLDSTIVVNGVEFSQPMPAHTDLRNLEIAEIITYITNSWGNEAGITSTREVEIYESECL
ncbi:MAG: cytochrome c [Cyclobacteriaceae bacterium]